MVNERMGAAVSSTANEIFGIKLKADATGYVCEALAIYNALIIIGKRVSFSEIILMCELFDGLMLGGFFGAKHTVAECIAEKYSLGFSYTTDINTMNSWVPFAGVVILTYLNDKRDPTRGIHTVTAKYEKDKETGKRKIIIYNYTRSEPTKETLSFAEFFESTKHGLIGAYYLYDLN